MSELSELVNKGVRLIVTDPDAEAMEASADLEAEPPPPPPRAGGRAPVAAPPPPPPAPAPSAGRGGRARGRELSAEVANVEPPRQVTESHVAADVQDFGAVYKEAAIELPKHGYGVDKVGEMLQGKRLATLAREVRATAVLAALEAAQVDIQDVVQDGVRRDKALDGFEACKERELQELKQKNEQRIESLRSDMEELLKKINAEIEKLKGESQAAEAAFAQL